MSDNRRNKNVKKHQSYDINQRGEQKYSDRSYDQGNNQYDNYHDEEDQKKTFKERRKLRNKYFEKCTTDEQMETIEAMLNEYTKLSPLRIQVFKKRMTVPDYKFFIKSPEEFIAMQKHFSDPFVSRGKKTRWLRNTLCKHLGANQVQSNLDILPDSFIEVFFKLSNSANLEDFTVSEDEEDVIGRISEYILKKVQEQGEGEVDNEQK